MKKAILQGLLGLALFVGVYTLLAEVNWMRLFKVNQLKAETSKKLGQVFWEMMKAAEKEEKDTALVKPVAALLQHLVQRNGLDSQSFHLHLLDKKEVNAFALPGGHLVVHTGLLKNVENESELAGVLAHEMAHIQKDHVMKSLAKEMGLATLTSIATGGGELAREALQYLGSAAFSRQLEAEADEVAVTYLVKAQMDPKGMADFLWRLSEDKADLEKYTSWLNTHPAGKERSDKIKAQTLPANFRSIPVLSEAAWNKMKAAL